MRAHVLGERRPDPVRRPGRGERELAEADSEPAAAPRDEIDLVGRRAEEGEGESRVHEDASFRADANASHASHVPTCANTRREATYV